MTTFFHAKKENNNFDTSGPSYREFFSKSLFFHYLIWEIRKILIIRHNKTGLCSKIRLLEVTLSFKSWKKTAKFQEKTNKQILLTPTNPYFPNILWRTWSSTLHGHVISESICSKKGLNNIHGFVEMTS